MGETIVSILTLIAGPAGAIVLLAVILGAIGYGSWKLLNAHIIPGIRSWFEKQDKRFEDIMGQHKEDRAVFKDSVEILAKRLDKTEEKVDKIVKDFEEIKDRTFVCPRLKEGGNSERD